MKLPMQALAAASLLALGAPGPGAGLLVIWPDRKPDSTPAGAAHRRERKAKQKAARKSKQRNQRKGKR